MLRSRSSAGTATRYLVSSKVFWGGSKPNQKGLSRKHVTEAAHAALKRLRVDYLDLYFCHRPDVDTPIEETVWAMHNLVTQGKILYWGTSEWNAQQLTEALGRRAGDEPHPAHDGAAGVQPVQPRRRSRATTCRSTTSSGSAPRSGHRSRAGC